MMQNNKAVSINMRKKETKETNRKITPTNAILTSHDTNWCNLILEHHRQPAHEMPEVVFDQHILVVHINKFAIEVKFDGINDSKILQPGDLTLIPAKANYWSADREDSEFIVLSIEPQYLLSNNQDLIRGDGFELISTFGKSDPFIYATAVTLHQELIDDYHGCDLYAESLLNSLSVHLLRRYANKKPLFKGYSGGLPSYKLKLALDYINDNLDRPIKLQDIAQLLDISQYYFCHLFKESTGIAPYKYIIKQRVEKVKYLIETSKLSLADIAYKCGFSSQSQMTQHFRKCVGVTPRVYLLQYL